jgi:hypothetical protein
MRSLLLFGLLALPLCSQAQVEKDSMAFFIREIYTRSLREEAAYPWLRTLTKDIGHRLSGSKGAARAVDYTESLLRGLGLDKVWRQPVMVPHWVRGDKEIVEMTTATGTKPLNAVALGNSVGSGPAGVRGEVLMVMSLDELRAMPDEAVKGKIVFYNRPMDRGSLSTFGAYGGAADQRTSGPALAASKGAVGTVIRSLATRNDDFPHTGMTSLAENGPNAPAVALSTNDADVLADAVKAGKTEIYIRTTCQMMEDVLSYNVIGEIRGTTHPDEIILVGGHLDSWDIGEGAHDDGAGCMQSIEVIYRLRQMGYRPNRTIRCVMFMNEENGLRGGKVYADSAFARNEFHLAAIESDGGGSTPQAFGVSAGEGRQLDKHLAHLSEAASLLEPYDIELNPGGGGADIGPLKPKVGLLIGLRPDNARYFDYHHSAADVLESVNPREMAYGSATLTALVYLIDQFGIGE